MAFLPFVYLYPDNTQLVNIVGLKDKATGNFLDAATATATLIDQRGNPDPVLNGITLSYLPGSDGDYQGTVPATFAASLGGGYKLLVTAVQSGIQSLWTIPVIVRTRDQ
jgi:hypothetical protein